MPMIDAAIHDAVMALPPDERRDRPRINEAVRDGLKLGPLRPAGSVDLGDDPLRQIVCLNLSLQGEPSHLRNETPMAADCAPQPAWPSAFKPRSFPSP